MKLEVSFGARSLVGANDGLDTAASASRYAEALREVIVREWPGAEVVVVWTADHASVRAAASECDETTRLAVERIALDLAWVVKGCVPWGVPAMP